MKFEQEQRNGTKVSIEISDESTIDDACEAFQNFLRACGYVINYNEVIAVINMDEV